MERYSGLHLTRPTVKNKKIGACEQVDCVYGDTDDEEEVENAVG